jgi:hypothetical protein
VSTDLETRLREVLRDQPIPPEVHARIRSHALEHFGRSRRRTRWSWVRGSARWGVGIAGAAALALLIGTLIVATPSDPPADADRGTGVEYVLRAVPLDAGQSVSEAATSLAGVLRAKAEAMGITGLTAVDEGDRVTLFVPGTHRTGWAEMYLLANLNLSVYDNAASLVAADSDLERLLPIAQRAAPAAGGVAKYYAVVPQSDDRASLPDHLEGPYGSQQEAAKRAAELGVNLGGRPRVVAVGAAISLVLNYGEYVNGAGPLPVLAALRDPVVRPRDIVGIRAENATLLVTVAPDARDGVIDRVEALDRAAGQSLLMVGGASTLPGLTFEGYDASRGELTFRAPNAEAARGYAESSAGGGLDALVAVEQARPVGPPPARPGDPVATLPTALSTANDDAGLAPRPGTVLQVLKTDHAGDEVGVYSWTGRGGADGFGVTVGAEGTASECAPSPGQPLVRPCVAGALAGEDRVVVGRIGEDVEALRAAYADGSRIDAAVGNGWFVMFLPPPKGAPVRIDALGADGAVLETSDPATPGGDGAIFAPE